MADRIRFHLDEHVDPEIAKALRRHGIDVSTTVEANLGTKNDAEQWDCVHREKRVIVTHDADFLRIASHDTDHPGIAYCHKTARSIGEMIRSLILIYEVLTPEEITGQVEYL